MRKAKKRFLSALLACAMIVSMFPFAAFADGSTIYVDAVNGNDSNNGATVDTAYLTIQQALKTAGNGDTIKLADGTYEINDTLEIDKSVNIIGEGSDKTILQSTATSEPTTLIQVAGGNVDFSISDVYVKGLEKNTHNNSNALVVGSDSEKNSGKISITNCKFTDFTKNSITIKGGNAVISGNDIECKGYAGAAGNGIQIDQGATAIVSNNNIKGYESQSDDWSATGVLVLRNGKITELNDNTLENCQMAVSVSKLYADNDLAAIPDDLSSNTISNCDTAVSYELDGEGDLADILNNAQPGTEISLYGNTPYTLNSNTTIKDGVSLYLANGEPYYDKGGVNLNNGVTLTVEEGGLLFVDEGTTLTANGSLVNKGSFENYGTVSGSGTLTNNGSIINAGTLPQNMDGNGNVTNIDVVKTETELRDAIKSNTGKIITLGSDITLTDGLEIDKDITIDGNGHTITTSAIATQISAVNGESIPYSAIIAATDNANVILKNLVVKGNPVMASADNDLTHNTRYIGVAAINADLTMENCKVEDITYVDGPQGLQGMQNGFGVYAVSDSAKALTLTNTEITNFNKTAIIARDNINLSVDGCTITGFGEQAIIGQNGIQYAGNATVKNTTISGLIYSADNEWKNCSTAIYNVAEEGSNTNSVLDNVVCENVDSSYYTTGGTTTISGGSFVHVGDANAAVAGEDGAIITITSGKFDSDVSEYLDSGLKLDSNGNVYRPYTGKYSYEITVADSDNGTVSVDKYATEGEKVTITVTPDAGYKVDDLTVTAGSKDVKVENNGNGTYTFIMPSSKVNVAATFVEDEGYVEPDTSINISMTIGSNDFVVNNNVVTVPDAAPYIANDRTYVPFRALGEALGADVEWDNDARTVTYSLGDTEIVMTIGDTTYTVNGAVKTMDVAPEITGDRTYVPVRFVGEALGFKVTAIYAEDGTTSSVVFQK